MKRFSILILHFRLHFMKAWWICLFFICPVTIWGQFHIPEEQFFSLQEKIVDTITENTKPKPKQKTKIYIVAGTKTYNLVESPAVQITYLAEQVEEKAELVVSKPQQTRQPDIEEQKQTQPLAFIHSVPVSESFVAGSRNAKLINVQQRDYRIKTATEYEFQKMHPWDSFIKKQIVENTGLSDISKYRSRNYFTRPPPGVAG